MSVDSQNWDLIADAGGWRAPEKEEIWTKIDDEHGVRNVQKLTRRGSLFFTEPTGGMYVYYVPTHWHR